MALKFRKRIRILPGFTLNLSRSGISATVGAKGLSVNIGKNGTYLNAGIPGTGIYDRIRITPQKNSQIPNEYEPKIIPQDSKNTYFVETKIESYNPELLTSDTMTAFKQSILEAEKIKNEMYVEWRKANSSKNITLFCLIMLHFLIIGFFLKRLKLNYKNKKTFADELKKDYENFSLNIDYNFDKENLNNYMNIRQNFEALSQSERIWDVTSYRAINSIKERTSATRSIKRKTVRFYNKSLDFIQSEFDAFVLENANGDNLYIYPGFVIVKKDNSRDFGVVDIKNVHFLYSDTRFIEEEHIPADSENVGYTWKYCNKNGSPDRRYSNNYQIPIQNYGTITINSTEGLNEEFMVSNAVAASYFTTNLYNFINQLKEKPSENLNQDVAFEEYKKNLMSALDGELKFLTDKIQEVEVKYGRITLNTIDECEGLLEQVKIEESVLKEHDINIKKMFNDCQEIFHELDPENLDLQNSCEKAYTNLINLLTPLLKAFEDFELKILNAIAKIKEESQGGVETK